MCGFIVGIGEDAVPIVVGKDVGVVGRGDGGESVEGVVGVGKGLAVDDFIGEIAVGIVLEGSIIKGLEFVFFVVGIGGVIFSEAVVVGVMGIGDIKVTCF